jgi:hypothetical protein
MHSPARPARRLLPIAIVCCCLCPVRAATSERSASYLAALESITAQDLRRHVEYLADDALEGREAGTRGGRMAGDYVRDRLAELQLRGAGIDGGLFQPFAPNFRNVLALLPGSHPELKKQVIVVSAHYDHIGYGTRRNSRGPVGYIHNGADDNASGTSGLLELAEAYTMLADPPKRSILFAFWDAEEKGLLGSRYWIAHPTVPLENVVMAINLDMIGRLRGDRLTVFGTRSGYGLRKLLSLENQRIALKLDFSWALEPNSDHYPFFQQNIPVLLWHTGMHDEHHTPRDDTKLINYVGMSRVARLLFHVTDDLADGPEITGFRLAAGSETEKTRAWRAAHRPQPPGRLGVGWRPQETEARGVRLARVVGGSPAEKAGLQPGDRIVRCDGREIHSGDDLSGTVMSAENPVSLVVERPGRPEPLDLTVQLDGTPLRLGITWRVDDAEPGTIILTHVVPGSPAARAGLQISDRIYRIAGRDFDDDGQFARLASTLPEPLELLVERDGQLRTVVLYFQTEPLKRAA